MRNYVGGNRKTFKRVGTNLNDIIMKNNKKFKELVKPQMFDQNEISNNVTPFCSSGYSTTSSGMTCDSGYACGWTSVTSPEEGDDILI